MDGGWWEPSFSLLEWEVTDKQEKDRMIHVVNGLALETSVWTHVYFNVDTDGYIYKV